MNKFNFCLVVLILNHFTLLVAGSFGLEDLFKADTTINQRIINTANNERYGIASQEVFKLDSAGNTIWARDFSQPITTLSPYPNSLNSITQNGDHLFVLSLQGPGPGQSGNYFPAMIVLDTSGNVININYKEIFFQNFRQKKCFKANNGGVWSIYEFGGNYSAVVLYRTDSIGNHDPSSPDWSFQSHSTFLSDIQISSYDSCYLISLNSVDYLSSNLLGTFSIIKMDYNGNLRWAYTYYDTAYAWQHATMLNKLAIDQNGSIFVSYASIRETNQGYYSGHALAKLNSSGEVVMTKCWTQDTFKHFKFFDMEVSQDSIYVNFGPESSYSPSISAIFDTTFQNACMTPDSSLSLYNFGLFVGQVTYPCCETAVLYTPNQSSVNHGLPGTIQLPDYCNILGIEEYNKSITSKNRLNVYPNPASTELFISFTSNTEKLLRVELLDFKGSFVKSASFSGLSHCTFDLEKYPEGMYFVRISSSEKNYFKKIVLSR